MHYDELFTVHHQSDYVRMPWKNGLGETLEIAVRREEGEILYRISQASVIEDGLFSDFSGLHRTLVLLSGKGMLLEHESSNHSYRHDLTQPLMMARFAGGDKTYASLTGGKIEDLNIMVSETKVSSTVEALTENESFVYASQALCSAFYANQECTLKLEFADKCVEKVVKSQDSIFISQPCNLTIMNGAGVAINIDLVSR